MKERSTQGTGKPLRAWNNLIASGDMTSYAEVRLIATLLRFGGDVHRESHRQIATFMHMDIHSYSRARNVLLGIGWIEYCSDLRCLHRDFGMLGLRLTVEFYLRLESYEVMQSASEVMHSASPSDALLTRLERKNQEGERGSALTGGPAPPGPGFTQGTEMTRKTHEEDWGGDPIGALEQPSPSGRKKPTTRVWESFASVVGARYPTRTLRASAGKCYANIKWLLSEGFEEEVLIDSFHSFCNVVDSLPVTAVLWDEYFKRRSAYISEAQTARMGRRPGQPTYTSVKDMLDRKRGEL